LPVERAGKRGIRRSRLWSFRAGEEPLSDELLVAFNRIQMDMQGGILGELPELRSEGLEGVHVTLAFLQEVFQGAQQGLCRGLELLAPDLYGQVQEG
jgi:hypothetical protein